MANIIVGIFLLILGGLMALWTKVMVRFQIWTQRVIMGAQFIPSSRTFTVMRIIGAILAIIGVLVLISRTT